MQPNGLLVQGEYYTIRVFRHTSAKPAAPVAGVETIHNGEAIRIMRMHDIGATPDYGRDVIRIDIFEPQPEVEAA
jgi:hypothetical protein